MGRWAGKLDNIILSFTFLANLFDVDVIELLFDIFKESLKLYFLKVTRVVYQNIVYACKDPTKTTATSFFKMYMQFL